MDNSFFSSLIRSCTDFKFYKEVFNQQFGKTLRYLLFLGAIVTLMIGVRYGAGVNKFMKEGVAWIEKNAPRIEINDGIVTADAEQPYLVENKKFVMIVDTTGQIKEIDKKYKEGILLTKDKLIVKQNDIRTQEFDLKSVKRFALDKDTFAKWRKFFLFVIIPFMAIMQFFYFFVAKILQALVAGVLVLLVRPGSKFTNLMNICVYAVTPVTILSILVMFITTRPLILFPIIYMGMYIAFIAGALRQITTESKIES